MNDIPDEKYYHGIGLRVETINLYANALRYYADLLERDLKAFRVDPELAKLLDEESLKSFQIAREIDRSRDLAGKFEALLPAAQEYGDTETNMSHGLVRRLKSVSLLYLDELGRRRNAMAATHPLTTLGVEALDTKLSQLREKLSLGVFRDALPVPLLVDLTASPAPPGTASAVVAAPALPAATRIATTIELVDSQLRSRCVDLFNQFSDSQEEDRFDTVVSEATRILEDRVRRQAGLGPDISGVDLMTAAFGGANPILVLSAQKSEQEAAHLLFRGAFGFIRNPFHHRIIESVEKERVIQLLGFVDYLLFLTSTAIKRS